MQVIMVLPQVVRDGYMTDLLLILESSTKLEIYMIFEIIILCRLCNPPTLRPPFFV